MTCLNLTEIDRAKSLSIRCRIIVHNVISYHTIEVFYYYYYWHHLSILGLVLPLCSKLLGPLSCLILVET